MFLLSGTYMLNTAVRRNNGFFCDVKDSTSSYGVVDKCSSKQQICDKASIFFMVRKNWAYPPTASGSYGRLSDEMWVDSKRFEKSLQVELIEILTLLTSVQCYYSVKNACRRLF